MEWVIVYDDSLIKGVDHRPLIDTAFLVLFFFPVDLSNSNVGCGSDHFSNRIRCRRMVRHSGGNDYSFCSIDSVTRRTTLFCDADGYEQVITSEWVFIVHERLFDTFYNQ